MATRYDILAVYDDDGDPYTRDQWTEDGDGTITPVPGSALAIYIAANGNSSVTIKRSSYSDTAPAGPYTYEVDPTVSGIWQIATPDGSGGTLIGGDIRSVHVTERIAGGQSTLRFQAPLSNAAAAALEVGDFLRIKLGSRNYAGTAIAEDEWRFVITVRDPLQATDGLPSLRFEAADFYSLIAAMPTAGIPTRLRARLNTIPDTEGGTGGIPQMTVGGPLAYMLSHLLRAITPSGITIVLSAPDVMIERLPESGTALDMLTYALNSCGYYEQWDGYTLVISSHDPGNQTASCVITDAHAFEVRQDSPAGQRTYDAVYIERPGDFEGMSSAVGADKDKGPQGATGATLIPDEALTEEDSSADGDITIYRILKNWEPPQQYTEYEPGPIMFAFGDPQFSISGYTGGQIYSLLKYQPGQVLMTPPTKWTDGIVQGYYGPDYYFLFQPSWVKIQTQNDYIDGWVVSRSGYFTDTGAVSRTPKPIANARVLLIGQNEGHRYEAITNAAGYYRVENAVPDRYFPSVFLDEDTYLANKNDTWTTGHPYDDDPLNDETGPDNSAALSNVYQWFTTTIDFRVVYRTGREAPEEVPGDYAAGNPYGAYRHRGIYAFGAAEPGAAFTIGADSTAPDPANITSDLQARQLGEYILDRNSEERATVVITKPFGGRNTRAGNVVRVDVAACPDAYEGDVRIMVREIRTNSDMLLMETLSSSSDAFMDDMDRQYEQARQATQTRKVTEGRLTAVQQSLLELYGITQGADQMGRKV